MRQGMNRRRFLQRSAAMGGLVILGARSARTYAANDAVNVALVGVAGRGSWFVDTMPRLAHVAAVCDVNDRRAAGAFAKVPQAERFRDFRRMLDRMGDRLDAVVVATPDHTHAVITAAALHAGKAVLCEKPLTHDVFEAREVRRLAAETGLVTQMGNQGTASGGFRESVGHLWGGTIGPVREVHVWNTGGGAGPRPTPEGGQPVPEWLAWDVWLGPGAERPYHSGWLNWHTWRDFATGNLGNWASHTMNVAFKGLKVDALWDAAEAPVEQRVVRVRAEVSSLCTTTFPRQEVIRYDVPARGPMPRFQLTWYNGAGGIPEHRASIEAMLGYRLDWGDAGENRWADHAGCLLVGTQGKLHSNGHNTVYRLLPEDAFAGVEPPVRPSRSRGHEQEWLDAIRGRGEAMSAFGYSGRLAEFVLLGNVATLVEETIEYDPVTGRIVNSPTADALLRREYRPGWSL